MSLPVLYKLSKTGKIQIWSISVDKDSFTTRSGQLDGKKTISSPTICKPKNIGKKNETSGEGQALLEAKSKWQKKLDGGYHDTIKDVYKVKFVEPMLARKYKDVEVTFPCISQPKLDGMRCTATKNGLFSRNGIPIVSVPHIWDSIKICFDMEPDLIIDGELYNHDLKDDFNTIISHTKKTKRSKTQLEASKKIIQYHVYDCPSFPNNDPLDRLCHLSNLGLFDRYVRLVDTVEIDSQEELDIYYANYIEGGYEGQMIRTPGEYQFGRRSKFLLKRKEFLDSEFEIVDITEGVGGRAKMFGRVTLKHNGSTFMAGALGTHEYYKELLRNKDKLIGKQATVRYQNLTPDGTPRFGIMVSIRDYE